MSSLYPHAHNPSRRNDDGTELRRGPLPPVPPRVDWSSSASQQHYIDTGRYLTAAESAADQAVGLADAGHAGEAVS